MPAHRHCYMPVHRHCNTSVHRHHNMPAHRHCYKPVYGHHNTSVHRDNDMPVHKQLHRQQVVPSATEHKHWSGEPATLPLADHKLKCFIELYRAFFFLFPILVQIIWVHSLIRRTLYSEIHCDLLCSRLLHSFIYNFLPFMKKSNLPRKNRTMITW